MSGKSGFAHGEAFGAHAVSGKSGFAHGEAFGAPHGEQKNQICSQQDGNPSDSEGASAPRRRKGALRPTEAPVRNGVQGGMPHGAAAAAAGVDRISRTRRVRDVHQRRAGRTRVGATATRSSERRRCGHVCAANHAGARSRGVRGWAPVYKKRGSVTFVIEPLEERRLPTLPPGGAVPSA